MAGGAVQGVLWGQWGSTRCLAGGAVQGVLWGWPGDRGEEHPEETSFPKPAQRCSALLSKSLERDLERLLQCSAERGPSRGRRP